MKKLISDLNEARANVQKRILTLRKEADSLEAELKGNALPESTVHFPDEKITTVQVDYPVEMVGPDGSRHSVNPGSSTDRVLRFLAENPGSSSMRISRHLRTSRRNTASIMARLLRYNGVTRTGERRTYRWFLKA